MCKQYLSARRVRQADATKQVNCKFIWIGRDFFVVEYSEFQRIIEEINSNKNSN
jgi:hypothetical protein